jgi:UDP-N-acetylmuramoyl-L-alanyl-D-glutamate--2,6-diaminopimelate ligase
MTGFVHQTLKDLLDKIPVQVLAAAPLNYQPVTGITSDSRAVQPGSVFVALVGERDGHDFIPESLKKGAIAVVGSKQISDPAFPYIQVADTRHALAYLSAAFYSFPARQMTMIGVTGTDGKTTTSTLIYQILLAAGLNAGIISTVNAVIGDESIDTGFHVTTPEAPEVQRYLARMVDAGLTHVVLEATSHGLAQQRVTGCEFDVAVVTNITHEHLDYHGTYEAYRAAKARLFKGLSETSAKPQGNPRLAVLNRDDVSYDYLSRVALARGATFEREAFQARRSFSGSGIPDVRQVAYSLQSGDGVWAGDIRKDAGGLRFTAHGPGFDVPVISALVGDYNVSNCLAAIAATVTGLGIPPETAARGIARMHGVPGRMERIDLGQDFTAIVDFAHTPNALRVTLETARSLTLGRVIAVFGSAGLRDRTKRRLMAEVSGELADLIYLTAEDPRTESLEDILAEMAAAARSRGAVDGMTLFQVADRGQAIRQAVEAARPGDLVIACGKGHEQSMCFGTTEYPWDDRTAMNAALSQRLGIEGPAMPWLPTCDKP